MKGDEMRNRMMFLQREHGVYNVLLPGAFLSLMLLPSVALYASWEPIGPEGGNFIFSVTNPMDANEVMAITTNPSPSNVYRSADGGISWNKIGEIPSSYISDVTAFDFSIIYAITSSRCYRSIDGGVSWTTASLPSSQGWAYRVCVDPTDSSKVYAAGYIYDYQDYPYTYNMVFFKSTDGGLSWSTSSFFTFDSFYPYDMAISESNPSVMYVSGYKQVDPEYFGALFVTLDGGNTWTDISSSVETEPYNYFESVAIDPTNESRVYVGGSYLYRSSRTGRGRELSWERSQRRLYPYAIDIDPVEPSRIYTAGYESMSVSTDYGQSWRTLNGCVRGSVRYVEVAPADPSRVYVSSYAGL